MEEKLLAATITSNHTPGTKVKSTMKKKFHWNLGFICSEVHVVSFPNIRYSLRKSII